MRNFTPIAFVVLTSHAAACSQQRASSELVGTWMSTDGATIEVSDHGRFVASNLPSAVFFKLEDTFPSLINGAGTWALAADGNAVILRFEDINGKHQGYTLPIGISGKNQSTFLYGWLGEAGEGRYKLERKVVR